MNAGHFLDLERWPRRSQYLFFRDYELPFFNICAEVPVTRTLAWCRDKGRSFNLACWFVCQRAINENEPFRYRLRGDRVWVHDRLRVATTFLNEDETFRFAYLPYAADFETFERQARAILEAPPTEHLDDRPEDDAVIHGSTLPWVRFTSVSNSRRLASGDAIPKIIFGRYGEQGAEHVMPVSVEVHHGLMDGLHASRFFAHMERELADPEAVLGRAPAS